MEGAAEAAGRKKPARVIAHVDMDAFFVAVERTENPALEGKPVIVGGSVGRRGVVAAASYEARDFGVRSAMPMATARRLCPRAVYLPSNFALYRAASERVREVLRGFSPLIEAVSVDEAYLDLTGTERLYGPPFAAAARIREAILTEVNCSASIGVAANRLMSKIASELAKPAGILHILPGREAEILAPLEIGRIPGVGKVTAARLRGLGIRTAGELARTPRSVLESQFKGAGAELYRKARGEGADGLATERAPKSVGKETTFGADQDNPLVLESVLASLAAQAAARLRRKALSARTLTLKIRFSDFTTFTRAAPLEPPTALERPVAEAALRLLSRAVRELAAGRRVRLLGVYLSGLGPDAPQLSLLPEGGRDREARLGEKIDAVRERFGFPSLTAGKAIEGLGKTPKKRAEGGRPENPA